MSNGNHHIKLKVFGLKFTFSIEDDLRKALEWALPNIGPEKIDAIITQIIALYLLNDKLQGG